MTEDGLEEIQEHSQKRNACYRIWRRLDPMTQGKDSRNGVIVEACLIGCVLIAAWVNAGIVVWCKVFG